MNTLTRESFIQQFLTFEYPEPNHTQFTEEELKNNDMKLSLEIATGSKLRMQSQSKSNLISFSCKKYGKSCFQIFAQENFGCFTIRSNYKTIRHVNKCQLENQNFEYLRIYNLMKLKKNLIENYMIQHSLSGASPSQILSHMSEPGSYFFQNLINQDTQMRKKIRKRFDNIINIDIKKITKGGRDSPKKPLQKLDLNQYKKSPKRKIHQQSCFESQQKREVRRKGGIKTKKIRKEGKSEKSDGSEKSSELEKSDESEKFQKQQKAPNNEEITTRIVYRVQTDFANSDSLNQIKEVIYYNPKSEQQLQAIRQLNRGFNYSNDFWSGDQEDNQQYFLRQAVPYRLGDDMFISLQNSLLRASTQNQNDRARYDMGSFLESEEQLI